MTDTSGVDPLDSIIQLAQKQNPGTAQAPKPQQAPVKASDPTSVVDPFTVSPKIQAQAATVQGRAQTADDLLNQFTEGASKLWDARDANLATTVKAKDAINDELTQSTANFRNDTVPLLQQRVNIANRQAELQRMNPLKRSIFGIFDNTYNPDKLADVDKSIAGQISARASAYQSDLQTQDESLHILDEKYQGHDAAVTELLNHGSAIVENAAHGVGSASQLMDSSIQALNAQNDITRAQEMARSATLSNMSHADINSATAEAKKSNGVAMINGVPISLASLQEAGMNWEQKELSLSNLRLAHQNEQMDLADKNETRLIGHLTSSEIQATMQNGGKYHGVVLNQLKLTSALQASQTKDELNARTASMSTAAPVAIQGLTGINNSGKRAESMSSTLFGGVPPELANLRAQQAAQTAALTQGAAEAKKTGSEAAYWSQNLPMVQKMQADQQKLVNTLGTRWAGGHKELVPLGNAVIAGTQLNSADASDGFIFMARNGIKPAGLSGASLDAYNIAVATVKKFDTASPQGPGNFKMPQMNMTAKQIADQQKITLRQQVQSAISNQYNSNMLNQTIQAAPKVAGQMMDPDTMGSGQPHPFSKVSQEDWGVAQKVGDEKGYQRMAQQLGVPVSHIEALFSGGKGSQEFWAKSKIPQVQATKMLNSYQLQESLIAVDHTPSAKNFPDGKPSRAYVNLVNDPGFQGTMMRSVGAVGGSTPGDFFASAISGSDFDSRLLDHSKAVTNAYTALQTQDLHNTIDVSKRIRNIVPTDSAKIALGMVGGLTTDEQNGLLQAATQSARQTNPQHRVTADGIDQVILHGKFQDPNLERVRKTAAKDWATLHPGIRKGVAGLADIAGMVLGGDSQQNDAEDAFHDYLQTHPDFKSTGQ